MRDVYLASIIYWGLTSESLQYRLKYMFNFLEWGGKGKTDFWINKCITFTGLFPIGSLGQIKDSCRTCRTLLYLLDNSFDFGLWLRMLPFRNATDWLTWMYLPFASKEEANNLSEIYVFIYPFELLHFFLQLAHIISFKNYRYVSNFQFIRSTFRTYTPGWPNRKTSASNMNKRQNSKM